MRYFVWLHVCDNFAHAEEQAKEYIETDEQIVRIVLEYEPVK